MAGTSPPPNLSAFRSALRKTGLLNASELPVPSPFLDILGFTWGGSQRGPSLKHTHTHTQPCETSRSCQAREHQPYLLRHGEAFLSSAGRRMGSSGRGRLRRCPLGEFLWGQRSCQVCWFPASGRAGKPTWAFVIHLALSPPSLKTNEFLKVNSATQNTCPSSVFCLFSFFGNRSSN